MADASVTVRDLAGTRCTGLDQAREGVRHITRGLRAPVATLLSVHAAYRKLPDEGRGPDIVIDDQIVSKQVRRLLHLGDVCAIPES
jgi:hypothetical protein